MIIDDREQSRQIFYRTWQKYLQKIPMEPLESLIVTVIQIHPEYHSILEDPDVMSNEHEEFDDGHNPFLHMGLHIALLEQINTNRPPGITSLYQAMLTKCNNEHQQQHKIMQCLEESLWDAQQSGGLPDEQAYMENLRKLP